MYTNLAEMHDSLRMLESYVDEGSYQVFLRESWDAIRRHNITFRDVNLRELHDQIQDIEYERDWRETKREQFTEGLERRLPRGREYMNPETGLLEAGGPVTTSSFTDIVGQISYNRVMQLIDQPIFIGRQLVETVPATTIGPEVIPGISPLGESAEQVGEGQDYPRVGMTGSTVTTPAKRKHGFISELSEEVEWEDKTGLLQRRFDTAANSMLQRQEKEILDVVLGVETSYVRNNGPSQATYANTHTQGDFDNLIAGNALTDFDSFDVGINAFDDINDPDTGEPLMIGGQLDVIVPGALDTKLANLMAAMQVKLGADSGAIQTMSPNPLPRLRGRTWRTFTSPYVDRRVGDTTSWFMGNSRRAFKYLEVWPIQVFRSDTNSDMAFERDIRSAVKVRQFGRTVVEEPRYMQKHTP